MDPLFLASLAASRATMDFFFASLAALRETMDLPCFACLAASRELDLDRIARHRQGAQADAGGIVDGVSDGGGEADHRGLAGAG